MVQLEGVCFLKRRGYISVGGGVFLEEEGVHFSWRGCV